MPHAPIGCVTVSSMHTIPRSMVESAPDEDGRWNKKWSVVLTASIVVSDRNNQSGICLGSDVVDSRPTARCWKNNLSWVSDCYNKVTN